MEVNVELLVGILLTMVGVLGWAGWVLWTDREIKRKYREQQQRWKRLPESVREGSPFVTIRTPNFVIGLYVDQGDKKVFLGTGWVLNGWVVTAGHVVHEGELLAKNLLMRHEDTFYPATGGWRMIATDLVAHRAPVGIRSAKIETINSAQHSMIVSASQTMNASLGVLKHNPERAYGFVEYSGSTRGGFSGSPYLSGERVVAMHLGGGDCGNFGYAASYIATCLRGLERRESSDLEAIRRVLRTAKKSELQFERGLDEARVRIGGRYWVIENDEFDDLFADEEFESYFFDEEKGEKIPRRWKKSQDPDYEPEGVGSEADDFLASEPPMASCSGAMVQPTESDRINTELIQSMQTCLKEISGGLKVQSDKLEGVCMYMQQSESNLLQTCESLVKKNISSHLEQLQASILSHIDARFSQEKRDSTSISNSCSPPSNQPAQPVSGTSRSTQPSVLRWATMDSDFEKFLEWRSLSVVSSPEYPAMRERYLESLGLSFDQRRALFNRLKNHLEKRRVLRRKTKPIQ